jgi:hypothetical protein
MLDSLPVVTFVNNGPTPSRHAFVCDSPETAQREVQRLLAMPHVGNVWCSDAVIKRGTR